MLRINPDHESGPDNEKSSLWSKAMKIMLFRIGFYVCALRRKHGLRIVDSNKNKIRRRMVFMVAMFVRQYLD